MEKKKTTHKKVVKMPNLKNNPIMNSKAQDTVFVSNAGIQMKCTERKLPQYIAQLETMKCTP